jgi:uncharacterized protein (DUF849 family)
MIISRQCSTASDSPGGWNMYFTDRSLLPENQPPLIITAAPYGPIWMPSDYPEDIPVSWDEQVQAAVDCYEAGARLLHIHVRDPKTGKISKNFSEYSAQIGRLREAVPDMVLQVGGSTRLPPRVMRSPIGKAMTPAICSPSLTPSPIR